MYRYTEEKKQRAKAQQAQRQQASRATRSRGKASRGRVGSSLAAGRSQSRPRPARTSQPAKSTSRRRPISWPDWLAQLGGWLIGLAAGALLLAGIYLVVMNTILPQFFHVDQEKNILLVGSGINERAERLYLVRLEPVTRAVEVWALSGEMDVELIAKYRQYPLSSVAPLGYRYSEDLQTVKSLYNFALGRVLDELYFVPDLGTIETRADLEQVFLGVLADQWQRTTRFNQDLLDNYFEVRSGRYFTAREVTDLAEVVAPAGALGRESLSSCPVVLVNAAATNGLARRVSDMIEPHGVTVVNWETAAAVQPQSVIYIDQNESDCQKVAEIVRANFPQGVEIIPDDGEQARKHRAMALLILGAELAN